MSVEHRQAICRCGSGRKYKKCCALKEHEEIRRSCLLDKAERELRQNNNPHKAAIALLAMSAGWANK